MVTPIEEVIEKARRTGAKKLDLSHRKLTELPASLFECESLEFLNLSNNALVSLPDGVARLRSLRELWLFANEISPFPAVLAGLPALKELRLFRNRIEEWPEIPGGWGALGVLDFSSNRLRVLPAHIARLPRLKRLIVSANPLQSISEDLSSRAGLTIYIGRDQVAVLPPALLESYQFNTPPSREEVQEYEFRRLRGKGNTSLVLETVSEPPAWVDDLSHVEDLTIETLTDGPIRLPDVPRLRRVTIQSGVRPNPRRYRPTVPVALERSSELESLTVYSSEPVVLPAFTARLPRLRQLMLTGGAVLEPLASGCPEPPFGGLENLGIHGEVQPGLLRQMRRVKVLCLTCERPPEDLEEFLRANPMMEDLTLGISELEVVPESIAGLHHLESLHLHSRRLTSLPGWIGSLPALRCLSLSMENLEALPQMGTLNGLIVRGCETVARAIEGVQRIQIMEVQGGEWNPRRQPEIESLELRRARCTGGEAPAGLKSLSLEDWGSENPPDWLRDCASLEELVLSSSEMSELPAWIGGLTKLRKLSVTAIHLKALPEEIGALEHLESLDIGGSLTALPEAMRDCASLEVLSLNCPGLSALPAWIGSLTKLRTLSVTAANLKTLPEEMGALANLEQLCIIGGLTTLPKAIGRLGQLKGLELSGNRLGAALRKLPALPKLEYLGISRNGLHSPPASLGEYTNLRNLNLSGNPVDFTMQSLEGLTELRVLDISECGLTRLPAGIERLSKLESIAIAGNGFHSLPLPLYAISDLRDTWHMWTPPPVDRKVANVALADAAMSSPYEVS